MESSRFDALTQRLAGGAGSLGEAPQPRRGALAALVAGTLGLVSVMRADAKNNNNNKKCKKKKCKKKKCPNNAADCPAGRVRLSNGTCASTCATPGQFVVGGCQCTNGPNTEGQSLLTPSVGLPQCNLLTQVCTSTAECPVGQTCLSTGCGGTNPNRCHAVCA